MLLDTRDDDGLSLFGHHRLVQAVQACRPNWTWREHRTAAERISGARLSPAGAVDPTGWLEELERELDRVYPAGSRSLAPQADESSQRLWQERWRRARCSRA